MMPKIIKMEDDDMDDIFDEEVEKSMEIKALLPIKQETPFYPEDTALSINISHTNENILDIKSEKVYEEIIDNFEIKLEEVDELKIEPADNKQIWRNKNIKSQKKKYYICVICQKKFSSARRRNNHLRIHFEFPSTRRRNNHLRIHFEKGFSLQEALEMIDAVETLDVDAIYI
ncbi:uncharacterized protein LOC126883082 isoform X4 [Diabrotica virgifera virgifera]|uniref:C2H2-type domain-containing protein n=1 Tax=Diabrotica virgifera virgifera TaxID=50390 RepID=A0ABM5K2T5_DIAVI|nr:uncharacterized protein LOC126883082 isoform X4 [Diabrotica virgifera virgifera]